MAGRDREAGEFWKALLEWLLHVPQWSSTLHLGFSVSSLICGSLGWGTTYISFPVTFWGKWNKTKIPSHLPPQLTVCPFWDCICLVWVQVVFKRVPWSLPGTTASFWLLHLSGNDPGLTLVTAVGQEIGGCLAAFLCCCCL